MAVLLKWIGTASVVMIPLTPFAIQFANPELVITDQASSVSGHALDMHNLNIANTNKLLSIVICYYLGIIWAYTYVFIHYSGRKKILLKTSGAILLISPFVFSFLNFLDQIHDNGFILGLGYTVLLCAFITYVVFLFGIFSDALKSYYLAVFSIIVFPISAIYTHIFLFRKIRVS